MYFLCSIFVLMSIVIGAIFGTPRFGGSSAWVEKKLGAFKQDWRMPRMVTAANKKARTLASGLSKFVL